MLVSLFDMTRFLLFARGCARFLVFYTCTLSSPAQDYRKRFSDHWRAVCKGVRFPTRDTVFDYFLHLDSFKFEPWKSSPLFHAVKIDASRLMSPVLVPTPETVSITYWTEVRFFTNQSAPLYSFVAFLLCCTAVCARRVPGASRRQGWLRQN